MENKNDFQYENKIDYNVNKKSFMLEMPIKEFMEYDPILFQRDTEQRATQPKVKKMLGILRATHLEVALIELQKDDDYYGKKYKKGYRAIVNGNTRKLFWEKGWTDKIPSIVNARIYRVDTMEEARDIYNQHDNPDSMEKNQQKVYGFLTRKYNFQPTCEKIQKGEFLTALNYACHKFDPKLWNQPGITPNNIPHMLATYIDEIKIFDSVCKTRSRWDQALICAALMAIKRYKNDQKNLKKLIIGLERIDQKSMDTTTSRQDGITFICKEWFMKGSEQKYQSKLTHWSNHGGFSDTVPYALYWIEQFMNDEKQLRCGNNWKKTADTWFDEFHTTNNSLRAILNAQETEIPFKLVA